MGEKGAEQMGVGQVQEDGGGGAVCRSGHAQSRDGLGGAGGRWPVGRREQLMRYVESGVYNLL